MNQTKKDRIILAKVIVNSCFRNTELENLHAGTFPSSKTGDYSDVKVVSPYGEIPWNELGRISDDEMKVLMKDCVQHTFDLIQQLEPEFDFKKIKDYLLWQFPRDWDNPK